MENEKEKISVIMGIYNCSETLSAAIESIINQTYTNWELIMCDDASTDNTYQAAEEYVKRFPNKMKLIRNKTNKGLNETLNVCLSFATGNFIARMDGDDVCSPTRFERQLDVFLNEPNISIVSTDMEYFDINGVWGSIAHPTYPSKKDFIYGTPFCHAPCMVKKYAYDTVNGYTVSKRLLRVEDYHLWIKMYEKGFVGKNLHENLYQMRDDQSAISRRKFKYRINESYVRILAVKKFNLPKIYYLVSLRPIVVGLLPVQIYALLHKIKLRKL